MKKLHILAVVGIACVLFVPAARSEAGADSDTSKAAARFQQAVELYREGSFEGALAEFRKAYQLSPSYRVLYNIAQTQYALRDFVGAYKSLNQYVSEGRGEIPADRRTQVDEMSAKLADRIAHLHLVTNVDGAEVRVDDVTVGRTPFSELVPVNVGTRRVTMYRAGAPVAVKVVTVAGKEKLKVELLIDESEPQVPVFTPQLTTSTTAARPSTELSVSARKAPEAGPPSRLPLYISLSTTAALAATTGVFGYLALSAQQDFKDQLNTFPNSKTNIEDARSKSKQYALITDALGAATLLAGGAAAYFWLTLPSEKSTKSVALSPTVGGMVLSGRF